MLQSRTMNFLPKVPAYGICIFVILYFVAAFFYPGGSQADKTVQGFSWLNNYWCDLLNEKAKNGHDNTARPIAIFSWLVLCFSLSIFWYYLPRMFSMKEGGKNTIVISGIASMLVAVFLFTSYHDVVIQVAGLFGIISNIGALIGLYKTRLYGFFYTGVFCFILMILNYVIMVGNIFAQYQPLIQKLTFLIVLLWVAYISRRLNPPVTGN
jgi:hypothetical protein